MISIMISFSMINSNTNKTGRFPKSFCSNKRNCHYGSLQNHPQIDFLKLKQTTYDLLGARYLLNMG